MTDVNEQSFSAGIKADSAAARAARPPRSRVPAPLWRFRPSLQPVGVVRTIKTRIIPKIVLALLSTQKTPEPVKQEGLNEIAQFAALALGEQDGAAFAFVQGVIARGTSVDSVFLDLLAPTARHLGELWESDAVDFANVTLAVGRLQMVMRRLGDAFFEQVSRTDGGESALADDHSRRTAQFWAVDGCRVLPPRRLEPVHRAILLAPGADISCA